MGCFVKGAVFTGVALFLCIASSLLWSLGEFVWSGALWETPPTATSISEGSPRSPLRNRSKPCNQYLERELYELCLSTGSEIFNWDVPSYPEPDPLDQFLSYPFDDDPLPPVNHPGR